ncbi:MAG: zinc-dependent alcohol dehydrogenase [Candidatus Sumerlaeia bacterium]
MLQAVMTKPGEIEYRDVDKPAIKKPNQVIVRMERIGVCGSDIHVYHGTHPFTGYPVVQGHEVSGVIEEVGSDAGELKKGDKVTIMPQEVCGECYYCTHGMYHICQSLKVMGFQTEGAGQEYFRVDAEKVLRLPEDMSLDYAAMIEPVSVAVHAMGRFGSVEGLKVLVLGAGTIGNLTAQTARALGAADVMITDISDYKLGKAKDCGIDHAINTKSQDLGASIRSAFGDNGADVIFECVGAQATIDQAVENARKASTIVVVGVFGEKPKVNLSRVQDCELSLIGTLMYQQDDYEKAIELIAGGKMQLDPMITHRFGFRDFLKAYETIEEANGESLKVMIDVQDN